MYFNIKSNGCGKKKKHSRVVCVCVGGGVDILFSTKAGD